MLPRRSVDVLPAEMTLLGYRIVPSKRRIRSILRVWLTFCSNATGRFRPSAEWWRCGLQKPLIHVAITFRLFAVSRKDAAGSVRPWWFGRLSRRSRSAIPDALGIIWPAFADHFWAHGRSRILWGSPLVVCVCLRVLTTDRPCGLIKWRTRHVILALQVCVACHSGSGWSETVL